MENITAIPTYHLRKKHVIISTAIIKNLLIKKQNID